MNFNLREKNKNSNNTVTKETKQLIDILKDFSCTKKTNVTKHNYQNRNKDKSGSRDSALVEEFPAPPSKLTTDNANSDTSPNIANNPSRSYTNEINDTFQTFKDMKEIIQTSKFLKCTKNIAYLTKKTTNLLEVCLL